MIVEQREVQREGGVCAKYPSSCLVRRLLNAVGLLQWGSMLRVLDLSYGEGRFWAALRSKVVVVGFDIAQLRWVVPPRYFVNDSALNWRRYEAMIERVLGGQPDLVVADPPFSPYDRGWERRRHYRERCSISEILTGAEKAAQYYNAPLLIHFSGRYIPYGFQVIVELWWKPWSSLSRIPRPTWWGILAPTG